MAIEGVEAFATVRDKQQQAGSGRRRTYKTPDKAPGLIAD